MTTDGIIISFIKQLGSKVNIIAIHHFQSVIATNFLPFEFYFMPIPVHELTFPFLLKIYPLLCFIVAINFLSACIVFYHFNKKKEKMGQTDVALVAISGKWHVPAFY